MDMDTDEDRLFTLYVNTKAVCLVVCRPHACFVRICSKVEWNLDLDQSAPRADRCRSVHLWGIRMHLPRYKHTSPSPCLLLFSPPYSWLENDAFTNFRS